MGAVNDHDIGFDLAVRPVGGSHVSPTGADLDYFQIETLRFATTGYIKYRDLFGGVK